jgi:uracil-DNA glycosylase family 4
MPRKDAFTGLNERIMACDACPRLREYCAAVAGEKRRAFADWDYWGRPVPNFGDPQARLLIVGLAPAAHGANRTGRMFTGDRSGEWLYRALHRGGFASQPTAIDREDGLVLRGCAISAVCHCAPPENRPLPEEVAHCRQWLAQSLDCLPATVFLALGQIAWQAMLREARAREWLAGKMPKFGHQAELRLSGGRWLLGSYHPSQQNTFTGRLTEAMLDAVIHRAGQLCQL